MTTFGYPCECANTTCQCDAGSCECDTEAAEPLLDGVAPHIPGTDYYDGRDGSIEAEEDDEETIADAEAHREDWQDYLEFQRTSH